MPSEFILFATRPAIRRISLDTDDMTSITVVPDQKNAIAVEFHAASRTIFWTDVQHNTILRSDYDGSNAHIVVQNLTTPDGIAVDWVADNLYWTDTGTDTISVSRLDGSLAKVIVDSHLEEPRDIAVFPEMK